MATKVEITQITGHIADTLVVITDSNNNVQYDVAGGGAGFVHQVAIDCTNNPGEDAFTRFFPATSGVTVGTTDAEMLLWGIAGQIIYYDLTQISGGGTSGIPIATGIAVATVAGSFSGGFHVSAGATSGATAPSGVVNVYILASA